MKKTITYLACIFMLYLNAKAQTSCMVTPYPKTYVGFDCTGSGVNIINNPDFETGSNAWSLLPNASRAFIFNDGYNSDSCIKLISQAQVNGDAFISQTIPILTPGSQVTISAYLKSDLPVNNKSKSVSIQVRCNYPNGSYNIFSKTFFPNNVWTKYSHTFTISTNPNILVSLAQVSMYRGQNASMYVDSIEILSNGNAFPFVNSPVPVAPTGIFYEDFKGYQNEKIACNKWMVVKKSWGNGYVLNNNGVVPQNLELLCDGGMRFHGHGDLYNGPIMGATTDLGNGKIRTGACIATKDYYASGMYEVVAKLTPGMVNAFWTFHYIEDANYQSGGIKNTEIDYEFPSNSMSGQKHIINDGLCNTWGGICNGVGLSTAGSSFKANFGAVDLSQAFHKYSFEWHTGDSVIAPSIKWYIDDVFVKEETNPNFVPVRASRFWVGVWFGNNNWLTGGDTTVMQYEDKYMDVQSVKITPYYEANDVYQNETNASTGYVTPYLYPVFPCTNIDTVGAKSASNNENKDPIIRLSDLNNQLELYSNINTNSIQLKIDDVNKDYITNVKIYSINGQLLNTYHNNKENNTMMIPLQSTFPNGIYFLQATTIQGSIYKKQFVINHM